MTLPPVVQEVDCETPEEFLDAVSARGPYFRGFGPEMWIFRGHADAKYRLVPKALRIETCIDFFGPQATDEIKKGTRVVTDHEQAAAELELVQEFFDIADRAGLPLPEDSQSLRRGLLVLTSRFRAGGNPCEWPPDELLSLMALGNTTAFLLGCSIGPGIPSRQRTLLQAVSCSGRPPGNRRWAGSPYGRYRSLDYATPLRLASV